MSFQQRLYIMLAALNPFTAAYVQSDWFGKGIFISLFFLSAFCWVIILYKSWQFWVVKRLSTQFSSQFDAKRTDPFNLQFQRPLIGRFGEVPHPLFDIYRSVKQQALQLMDKHCKYVSASHLELLESEAAASMSSAIKKLDKHLFVLPMVVTLAPFLGLLGTVWGILLTFSALQTGLQASNAAMLSGLSMALATTVLGLLVAIPALIGYSYLKNACRENRREMEQFSHSLLAAIEVHREIIKRNPSSETETIHA